MSLCGYRDALGRPREGVHAARMIGDLARFDVLFTIIASLVLTGIIGRASDTRCYLRLWVLVALWLFLTGILVHRLFCVRTTIDRIIFP